MNKFFFGILILFVLNLNVSGQTIPIGVSQDSVAAKTPVNTYIQEGRYGVHYYKPSGYNSSSPILFFIHGTGGNGSVSIDIKDLADRQNALIVAPTMHNGALGWGYVSEVLYNTLTGCTETYWYTQAIKDIYRHVLNREGRVSIDTYLTGFSQGAQFVSRYMLVRQFSPDSIPIKMAVSVNPSNYSLMTNTYNSTQMFWYPYRCGLDGFQWMVWGCPTTSTVEVKDFICNEHIKQYYSENCGVLCGTADTQTFTSFCPGQGTDRWDRAKKFWAFSNSDAVTRGTPLKWVMDSVVGIGHDQINMYNTKRNVTDTFTIAERMLFKTPYHTVPQLTPSCLPIGINEITRENYLVSLYPSPNNGSFVLKVDNEIKNGELIILNSIGQKALHQKIIRGENSIKNTGFPSGLYHYILLQNKQKINSGKFVIE